MSCHVVEPMSFLIFQSYTTLNTKPPLHVREYRYIFLSFGCKIYFSGGGMVVTQSHRHRRHHDHQHRRRRHVTVVVSCDLRLVNRTLARLLFIFLYTHGLVLNTFWLLLFIPFAMLKSYAVLLVRLYFQRFSTLQLKKIQQQRNERLQCWNIGRGLRLQCDDVDMCEELHRQ